MERISILYKRELSNQLINKSFAFIVGWNIIMIFGTRWNIDLKVVEFLSYDVGNFGDTREFALQDNFIQLHQLLWFFVLVFFNPMKILLPLSKSFTVSNSLWLRLSTTNYLDLEVNRSMSYIGISIIIFFVSLIFAWLYSLNHDVHIRLLFQPILSLLGFMLLTGSLMHWFSPGAKSRTETRLAIAIILSAFPLCLYFLKGALAKFLGDFIPFAYPYNAVSLNSSTMKASITATVLALVLLVLRLVFSYHVSQKKEEK